MPGADDLAGEDLQVGHRVGAGAVGEHQVAVELVGVGVDRVGADQDVADPHRVRRLAAQRTLVGHPAAARARLVGDQQAVLLVLAGVGEEHAVELGVAAGPAVVDGRVEPDELTAERDGERTQLRVPADGEGVRAQVHGARVPVLQGDHGERRAVADVHLDVAGVGGAAGVVEHDGGGRERPGLDHQVAVGDPGGAGGSGGALRTLTVQAHDDRFRQRRLGGDRHGGRPARTGGGERGDPVGRDQDPTDPGVGGVEPLDGDPVRCRDRDRDQAVGLGAGRQATQAAQRGEPPGLLAPGGHVVVLRVTGTHRAGHGSGGRRGAPGGIDDGHQPTEPSICSSMSRLSSSAYSIGSSRAMGSTKPRTIIAIASSSDRPRLIR